MPLFKVIFKEARLKKGLQQKDIAVSLDCVPAYISRLEKGFSLPSNDLMEKVCSLLDLPPEETFLQVLIEKTDNSKLQSILEGVLLNIRAGAISPEAAAVAAEFAKLSPAKKRTVRQLVDNLLDEED